MSIANKILRLRKDSGASLQEVAAATGVSRAHIWDIETGRTKNPSLDLVRRLADHFRVTVSWLIGEQPDPEENAEAVVLYRAFQTLSPQNRQHIQAIIDSMRKAEEQ